MDTEVAPKSMDTEVAQASMDAEVTPKSMDTKVAPKYMDTEVALVCEAETVVLSTNTDPGYIVPGMRRSNCDSTCIQLVFIHEVAWSYKKILFFCSCAGSHLDPALENKIRRTTLWYTWCACNHSFGNCESSPSR